MALQKLAYLSDVHGVVMSWACFHMVEVMSSPHFTHKRISYHVGRSPSTTTLRCSSLSPTNSARTSPPPTTSRKKAIAVILRLFDNYPDAVRVSFKRLVENLESFDPLLVITPLMTKYTDD
ncbi:hypothetical protein Fmac_001014 [Flemingia macrophylla]|uniref:Uncharacterized protein n=1 Tax=Flemingia macrophylla TaxID=520843 RepID=A0ABD1NFW6_9FABA